MKIIDLPSSGRKDLWEHFYDLVNSTGGLVLQVKRTEAESDQVAAEVGYLSKGAARVVPTLDLANFIGIKVDIDALKPGEERIISYENPLFDLGDDVHLSSVKGLSSRIEVAYADHFFGEKPGAIKVTFNHLVDVNQPVRLADVIGLQVEIHHSGEIYYLDSKPNSIEKHVKFNPKDRAEIVHLQDVGLTVYLQLTGFYSADLIIRKHLKKVTTY